MRTRACLTCETLRRQAKQARLGVHVARLPRDERLVGGCWQGHLPCSTCGEVLARHLHDEAVATLAGMGTAVYNM